ncbi:MAG: hypothetical protein IKD53_04555 [Clostridia bacterium]|nr:hypothetical protein [Clostridia bacterium]
MYGGITLLNNESLFARFTRAREPQRMELLFEMARRVGTSGAMLLDDYRENMRFRASIDEQTVRLFQHYRLGATR